MQQVAWASAVVGAAVLLAGCSNGDGGLASSQDVVVKTVVVTPTVTASGSATPTPSSSSPTAVTQTATATATATVTATTTATATAGSAATAAGSGAPSPRPSSAQVANVQTALKRSGYYSGTVDGVEGAGTTAALKAFQRDHGLVVDGVAGSSFWAAVNGGSAPRATSTPTQVVDDELGATEQCWSDYAAWDAAVQAGRRSAANAAHARGQAHGCRPNTWLPSRATTKHDPVNTHQVGDACSMSEVGTYDAAGNVCTQDVTDHPHWN